MTRFCSSGRSVSASISAAAAAGAPGPTTSGSWRNSATFSIGDDLAAAVDQHELALILPDRERPPLLQDTTTVPGSRRSTVACSTQDRVSMRCARLLDREAEDRIALADAERRAQQRFRRVGAALDHHISDAQAGEGGGAAKPFAQRGERAAGCCRVHERTRPSSTTTAAKATQPAGRSSRFCRRSSSRSRPGRSLTALRGPRVYARHAAFSTIQAQSCEKLMP